MNVAWFIPCFAAAGAALVLASILVWKKKPAHLFETLSLVLGTVAWIHLSTALAFLNGTASLGWWQILLIGNLALPVALYAVPLVFITRLSPSPVSSQVWQGGAIFFLAALAGVMVLIFPHEFLGIVPDQNAVIFKAPWGRVIWSFMIVALLVSVSSLEQVMRTIRDPLRYQLKFVIIGLAGIGGVAIAQAGRMLLLPVWKSDFVWVSATAACISIGLIAFGLARFRVQDLKQNLYVSQKALFTSLSFFLVGGYLLAVGLLTEIVQRTGWAFSWAVSLLIIFLAVMALLVVVVSRQARGELQHFLRRHFYRSKYDYRAQWLEMTHTFVSSCSTDHILDEFLPLVSRTFSASRITMWLRYEADGRFHQVRSVNTENPPEALKPTHSVVASLKGNHDPINLKTAALVPCADVDQFLRATQAMVCVPFTSATDQLMGFLTLSSDLRGRDYEQDDYDLLRVMAHHVAMLLNQTRLMEERKAAAEWGAVHRFSSFYLHDLKNIASGLSLIIQNAKVHGDDPEFQASLLRTISATAQRMTGIIEQLSSQVKRQVDLAPSSFQLTDINVLVAETIGSMDGTGIKPHVAGGSALPPVSIVPDQFKNVLLNVILNAKQAMGETGAIDVMTERRNEYVAVTVQDTGPGILSSRMRTLFQPFRSTKKRGLGIGLYQCKHLIEQNKGSIRVESREGEGTRVIIALPIAHQMK